MCACVNLCMNSYWRVCWCEKKTAGLWTPHYGVCVQWLNVLSNLACLINWIIAELRHTRTHTHTRAAQSLLCQNLLKTIRCIKPKTVFFHHLPTDRIFPVEQVWIVWLSQKKCEIHHLPSALHLAFSVWKAGYHWAEALSTPVNVHMDFWWRVFVCRRDWTSWWELVWSAFLLSAFHFQCLSVGSVDYLSHLEMENVQQVTNLSDTMHPSQD